MPLSTLTIFKFWAPLSAMWFLMALEGPVVMGLIARLSAPTENLAAFGVAFSLAFLIEAPVIMILSATAALLTGSLSFHRLRIFIYTLNLLCTAVMIICAYPPIYFYLAGDVLELPPMVQQLSHLAFMAMLPWPAAIGYRRFYQGVLVKQRQTRLVAWGTVVRVICMAVAAVLMFMAGSVPGAVLGSAALSFGVVGEAIAARLMTHRTLNQHYLNPTAPRGEELTYWAIIGFYLPLTLTVTIHILNRPAITFGMSKGILALESMAVLPVLQSLIFALMCVALGFQETVIVMIGDKFEERGALRRFGILLMVIMTLLMAFLCLPPIRDFLLTKLGNLPDNLVQLAAIGFLTLAAVPVITVRSTWLKGILLKVRDTRAIAVASAIEAGTVVLVLYVGIMLSPFTALFVGASAIGLSVVSSQLYMGLAVRKVVGLKTII